MPLCPIHQRELFCPVCLGQTGGRKKGYRPTKQPRPEPPVKPYTVDELTRMLEAAIRRKYEPR